MTVGREAAAVVGPRVALRAFVIICHAVAVARNDHGARRKTRSISTISQFTPTFSPFRRFRISTHADQRPARTGAGQQLEVVGAPRSAKSLPAGRTSAASSYTQVLEASQPGIGSTAVRRAWMRRAAIMHWVAKRRRGARPGSVSLSADGNVSKCSVSQRCCHRDAGFGTSTADQICAHAAGGPSHHAVGSGGGPRRPTWQLPRGGAGASQRAGLQ